MSTLNHGTELEEILHMMWAGGLDWATSDDFKELREGDDVEKADKFYLRYQNNLTEKCIKALNTYLYKQTLELIIDPPKSFDLVHSRTDTINHLNKIRKAAAERWGQE